MIDPIENPAETADESDEIEFDYLDFDEIAEHQNWDTRTRLIVCRNFITDSVDGDPELSEFARQIVLRGEDPTEDHQL